MTYPWQLYHWHFEVSSKCTLKCPRCPRNDTAPVPWVNKELDLQFFKKTLSVELLKNTVKRITFCGDIGDPIYASEFLDIIEYIKTTNPKIHIFTITNGSYRKSHWWEKFAALSNEYDTINFSVDGFDNESNNLYRVGSDWSSIMNGMSIMTTQSKIFVNWATILFKFNQDKINLIRKQAKEIGCDGLQLTYSTKFGSKYGNTYGGSTDPLEPDKDFISKTHRYERYYENISERRQDISDYLNLNKILFYKTKDQFKKFITPMCLIGNRGIYVSADGIVHPCSWVSFPYVTLGTERKTIKFENSFHQKYRDLLNLKERSLTEVLNDPVWTHLFQSFNDQDKAWVECEQKCNTSLVDENYAIGFLTN